MRVITRTHVNEEYEVEDHFEVELIDEETGDQRAIVSLNVSPDCPEDNTFDRDLSDVYNIATLIRLAYEAGKNGEDLTFGEEKVDW